MKTEWRQRGTRLIMDAGKTVFTFIFGTRFDGPIRRFDDGTGGTKPSLSARSSRHSPVHACMHAHQDAHTHTHTHSHTFTYRYILCQSRVSLLIGPDRHRTETRLQIGQLVQRKNKAQRETAQTPPRFVRHSRCCGAHPALAAAPAFPSAAFSPNPFPLHFPEEKRRWA